MFLLLQQRILFLIFSGLFAHIWHMLFLVLKDPTPLGVVLRFFYRVIFLVLKYIKKQYVCSFGVKILCCEPKVINDEAI